MAQQLEWAREDWVRESGLVSVKAAEVADRLEETLRGTRGAVVIFDLDSTLYEVAHRSHAIINQAVSEGIAAKWPLSVIHALLRLKDPQTSRLVGYSLKDTFRNLGLSLDDKAVEAACAELKSFWWNRFFTSPYLEHDKPYPGAVEFVQRMQAAGANVIYLTGRGRAEMWDGTVKNLKRDGLWWGEHTELLLRPDHLDNDLLHKIIAVRSLKLRSVVGSFENEPVNVASLSQEIPDALHVFLDTVCSDTKAPKVSGILKLNSWL